MASVMEIVVRARDQASNVISGVGEQAERTGAFIEEHWGKVTAAAGSAGAAAEGFARSQADTNATLSRAAIVMGETEESLRSSIDSMVDHTLSSHDAAEGMNALMQAGIDTREGIEETLPTLATFSDATGVDIPRAVGATDQVLNALGEDMTDVGDHIDQFTRLTTATDVPLGTLERNLSRAAPQLQELGFGVDEAAAGIEAFRDQGLDGREAVREFRRAVQDSEGDMSELTDTMGINEDRFGEYVDQVSDAEGLTEDFAAANNETMTPIERMQQNVENLMADYGGLADAAGAAAPVLISLGPVMRGVTLAAKGLGTALTFLSANPVVLIIAAVAALVAGFVLAYQNSETFRDVVHNVLESVGDAATWVWDNVLDPFFSAIMDSWDVTIAAFKTARSIVGDVMSAIGGAIESVVRVNRGAFNAVISGVESTVNALANAVNSLPSFSIPDWVPGPLGGNEFGLPTVPGISLARLHTGGRVNTSTPGGEGVALLRDQEVVRTDQAEDELLEGMRRLQTSGGDVHVTNRIEVGGEVVRVVDQRIESDRRNTVRRRRRLVGGDQ